MLQGQNAAIMNCNCFPTSELQSSLVSGLLRELKKKVSVSGTAAYDNYSCPQLSTNGRHQMNRNEKLIRGFFVPFELVSFPVFWQIKTGTDINPFNPKFKKYILPTF